jgi:hypothetical protein
LEQNTKKHDEEHQVEYEEAHTDVAEDREHENEKEDMGLKEGKALILLLYSTLSVWLQRALTDSKQWRYRNLRKCKIPLMAAYETGAWLPCVSVRMPFPRPVCCDALVDGHN